MDQLSRGRRPPLLQWLAVVRRALPLLLAASLVLSGCHLLWVFEGAPAGDAAGPDAGRPEAGGGDGSLPTCPERYGAAAGFILCRQTATRCHFNADLFGDTCGQVCRRLGGACLLGKDNPNEPGQECVDLQEPHPCDTAAYETEICVCTR